MSHIIWDDTFSVHNLELDKQHKRLVAILNNLHDAINLGDNQQSVSEVFTALAVTVKAHFTSEEQLMRQKAYSGLKQLQQENDSLIEQIAVLSKGVASGNSELIRDMQRFMENWWTKHITLNNHGLGPFLKQ